MTSNPCHTCNLRTPTCHAYCLMYADWTEIHEAERQQAATYRRNEYLPGAWRCRRPLQHQDRAYRPEGRNKP